MDPLRAYRRLDLFTAGSRTQPQRHRKSDKYSHHPHTHAGHCTSCTHGTQPYIPKSYRGSSDTSITFNIYICITYSVENRTGSSNRSHSHTCLSVQNHSMVQLMLCKCIRISLEVRAIVLRSCRISTTWLQNSLQGIEAI